MSWVRKSEQELKLEERARRFGLRFPALIALCAWVLLAITQAFKEPLSLSEVVGNIIPQIVSFFPAFFIVFLVVYLFQILNGGKARNFRYKTAVLSYRSTPTYYNQQVVLCDRCFSVKALDDVETCTCGGHFEFIEKWKWVGPGHA